MMKVKNIEKCQCKTFIENINVLFFYDLTINNLKLISECKV